MRLAEKIKQLEAQEEEIRRLMHQRFEMSQRLNEKMIEGIQVGEYLIYKKFTEDSYNDLLQKETKKKKTMEEVEGEREHLIVLMKERKVLEKIKEKRFKKFISQMEKLEQKSNDEMVVMKYRPTPKEDSL